ncbi:MAG: recombinase family protein [Candidatus Galacturonibacter soehngenii]|nr:recombinase family protein [Candidatus Galacturonibacter soehngenii]
MKYVGYNRTSTKEQHLDRGDINIEEYCSQNNIPIKKIYTDKQTGKNFNRPRYIVMKEDVLEPGDTLIISEVDRLGRNKREILKELQYYKDNNIRVMILELPTTLIDYSKFGDELAKLLMDTINNMMIEMYASFAEAEMHKREKRQREGIEAMKARGEWNKYGRPKVMDVDVFTKEYEKVLRGEQRPVDVMNKLNMKKATYYLYRKQFETNKQKKDFY